MIRCSSCVIFLSLLSLSYGFWGKSKKGKKKDVEVLEVHGEADWTDLILPVFNFGFDEEFYNLRRGGCTCQLTTPSPREICPSNVTMDVTHGQHKWWKGKEMRRHKGRYKRHNWGGGRHHGPSKYKKTKLKSGCPVSVPSVLPPCPEKISVRKARHTMWRKGSGGKMTVGKYKKKQDSSSSEEDDATWFRKSRQNNKKETSSKRCVDPKTRQTKTYYPEPSASTKYTYKTRYITDREGTTTWHDATLSSSFAINTSPITSMTDFEISASKTIFLETPTFSSFAIPESSSIIWSSVQSSQFTSASSWRSISSGVLVTAGLDDLLNTDRRHSSLAINEQPVSTFTQWRSSITVDGRLSSAFGTVDAGAISSKSILPTVTWKSEIVATTEWRGESSIIHSRNKNHDSDEGSINKIGIINGGNKNEEKWVENNRPPTPEDVLGQKKASFPTSTEESNSETPRRRMQIDDLLNTKTNKDQNSGEESGENEDRSSSTDKMLFTEENKNKLADVTVSARNDGRNTWPKITELPLEKSTQNTLDGGILGLINKKSDEKYPDTNINTSPRIETTTTTATTSTPTTTTSTTTTTAATTTFTTTKMTTTSPTTTTTTSTTTTTTSTTTTTTSTTTTTTPTTTKTTSTTTTTTPTTTMTTSYTTISTITFKIRERTTPPTTTTEFVYSTEARKWEPNGKENILHANRGGLADSTDPPESQTSGSDTKLSINDLINKNTNDFALRTPQTSISEIITERARSRGDQKPESSIMPEYTTKTYLKESDTTINSLFGSSSHNRGSKEDPKITANNLNQIYTTKNSLFDSTTHAEKKSDPNGQTTKLSLADILRNDKITDEPAKVTTTLARERMTPAQRVAEDDNRSGEPNSATSTLRYTQGLSSNNNAKNEGSSGNAMATSSGTSNQRATSGQGAQNPIEAAKKVDDVLRETSGADDKKSESNEKNKSPLTISDLLGAGRSVKSDTSSGSNGKEITFSGGDKSVTENNDTKYYLPSSKNEPTANNNFHKPGGADTTPPQAKTSETINPASSTVNNWQLRTNEKIPSADKTGGGGSLSDLLQPGVKWSGPPPPPPPMMDVALPPPILGAQPPLPPVPFPPNFPGAPLPPPGMGPFLPPQGPGIFMPPPFQSAPYPYPPPQVKVSDEADDHRKYAFYLLFGNSNCNVCGGPPAVPNISINRNINKNDTSAINWLGGNSAGSMSDGEGGSFYIGHRKKGEDKTINPLMEIKMSPVERSCNSIYSSFFA